MTPTSEQLQNRILWVEALRSGKYTQTSGCLRDDHGYCCLGVACDVLGLPWAPSEDDDYHFSCLDSTDVLPDRAQKLLGFRVCVPTVHVTRQDDSAELDVADLNDSGADFKELADLISAEYILPFS